MESVGVEYARVASQYNRVSHTRPLSPRRHPSSAHNLGIRIVHFRGCHSFSTTPIHGLDRSRKTIWLL